MWKIPLRIYISHISDTRTGFEKEIQFTLYLKLFYMYCFLKQLPTVAIKFYNVLKWRKHFFAQLTTNNFFLCVYNSAIRTALLKKRKKNRKGKQLTLYLSRYRPHAVITFFFNCSTIQIPFNDVEIYIYIYTRARVRNNTFII